jgi:DNA-binding response OmpR family regulator
MEITMVPENAQQLTRVSDQLADALKTATTCAGELHAAILADGNSNSATLSGCGERPLVDEPTLTLRWANKRCKLGYNRVFRLAARLARRPNQYIPIEELLTDVWDGDLRSPSTVRSTIRHLKDRLNRKGMNDLAAAIQSEGGRYGLILNGDI